MKHVTVTEAHALAAAGRTRTSTSDRRRVRDRATGRRVQRAAPRAGRELRPDAAESGFRPRRCRPIFPPDAKLLVGCQVRRPLDARRADARGVRLRGRHQRAGGFGGGAIRWAGARRSGLGPSGLPVETTTPPGHGYGTWPPRPTARSDHAMLSRLGTPARVGRHQSHRPAVRVGPRLARARGSDARSAPRNASSALGAASRWPTRDRFFAAPPLDRRLRTPTATCSRLPSAHRRRRDAVNNTVVVRMFPAQARNGGRPRRAVVVLPQWNSDPEGHVGLCQLLARFGVTALRLSLPYHDERRPPELAARRLHRQRERRPDAAGEPAGGARRAARGRLAARRATSASASSARASARACRCWRWRTTRASAPARSTTSRRTSPTSSGAGSRRGTCAPVSRDTSRSTSCANAGCRSARGRSSIASRGRQRPAGLRALRPDVPGRSVATFIAEFERRGIPHTHATLPCGHYTTGKAPFKYLDGYYLTRFLVERL